MQRLRFARKAVSASSPQVLHVPTPSDSLSHASALRWRGPSPGPAVGLTGSIGALVGVHECLIDHRDETSNCHASQPEIRSHQPWTWELCRVYSSFADNPSDQGMRMSIDHRKPRLPRLILLATLTIALAASSRRRLSPRVAMVAL